MAVSFLSFLSFAATNQFQIANVDGHPR